MVELKTTTAIQTTAAATSLNTETSPTGPQDPLYYGLPNSYMLSNNSSWSFFYRFSSLNDKKTFEDAKQVCREEGASLPIPISGNLLLSTLIKL